MKLEILFVDEDLKGAVIVSYILIIAITLKILYNETGR